MKSPAPLMIVLAVLGLVAVVSPAFAPSGGSTSEFTLFNTIYDNQVSPRVCSNYGTNDSDFVSKWININTSKGRVAKVTNRYAYPTGWKILPASEAKAILNELTYLVEEGTYYALKDGRLINPVHEELDPTPSLVQSAYPSNRQCAILLIFVPTNSFNTSSTFAKTHKYKQVTNGYLVAISQLEAFPCFGFLLSVQELSQYTKTQLLSVLPSGSSQNCVGLINGIVEVATSFTGAPVVVTKQSFSVSSEILVYKPI